MWRGNSTQILGNAEPGPTLDWRHGRFVVRTGIDRTRLVIRNIQRSITRRGREYGRLLRRLPILGYAFGTAPEESRVALQWHRCQIAPIDQRRRLRGTF